MNYCPNDVHDVLGRIADLDPSVLVGFGSGFQDKITSGFGSGFQSMVATGSSNVFLCSL